MTPREYTLGAIATLLLLLPGTLFLFMLFFEGFEGAYNIAFAMAGLVAAALWLAAKVLLGRPGSPPSLWRFLGLAIGVAIASWPFAYWLALNTHASDSGHGASIIVLILGTLGMGVALTCWFAVQLRRTLTSRSTPTR